MEEQWHKMFRGMGLFLMDEVSGPAFEVFAKLSYFTRAYDNTVYKPGAAKVPMTQGDIAKLVGRKPTRTRALLRELVNIGAMRERWIDGRKAYELHPASCKLGRGKPEPLKFGEWSGKEV